MRWGISGAPVPSFVPFYAEIEAACSSYPDDFPPCFLAAIKLNETGYSTDPAEMQTGTWPGSDYLALPDGSGPDPNNPAGHGPFQLTASWPPNWRDPAASAKYALDTFLAPSVLYMLQSDPTLSGDALIKVAAVGYNAGPGRAWAAHLAGNVDAVSTNNYGLRAVTAFHALIEGRHP